MDQHHRRIASLISRVRRRIRIQRAMDGFVTFFLVFLLGATALVYLLKGGAIDLSRFWTYLAACAGIPLLAAIVQAARSVRVAEVAKLIDKSHALHDRIGTAYEFSSEPERTDFMRAQIEEAVTHVDSVVPSKAWPFRAPRDLKPVGLLLLCLAFVLVVRFPGTTAPVIGSKPLPRLSVDPRDLDPHRDLLNKLALEAQKQNQPEIKKLADEMNKLFDELEKKKLTRKQLFAKLAQLEKKILKGLEGNFDELLKKLRKMGGKLKKDKLTKELGDALKKADLDRAKKEMEKLAKQLAKMKPKQQKKLARALKKAAQQKIAQKKLQKKIAQLKKQIRRLQRRLKKNPKNKQLKRRLARKRRQLQRLNRQQQRLAQQRRQLQRLNQQLNKAAQALLNKLSPKAMKALMKLAQQMGRYANQLNKMRLKGKALGNLQDLKEFLKRLGKGGKIRVARMNNFNWRAKGHKHKKGKKCPMCHGKKKGGMTIMPGKGGIPLPLPGNKMGQKPGGKGQQPGGQKPGHGTDPNVKGNATKLPGSRKNVFVKGKHGKGPSRSEVILGAADKGFSARTYKRVYKDYTQIVEDVLRREQIPLGYRYYVKHYFQLIKPR